MQIMFGCDSDPCLALAAASCPQGVLAPNVFLQRHSVRLFDGIVDGAESVVVDKDQAVMWMLDRWAVFLNHMQGGCSRQAMLTFFFRYTVVGLQACPEPPELSWSCDYSMTPSR